MSGILKLSTQRHCPTAISLRVWCHADYDERLTEAVQRIWNDDKKGADPKARPNVGSNVQP